jgi:branched-chain amino acid transport system permease protein
MSQVISVRRPSAGATAGQALKNAVAAALLTAILTIPVLGLQLKLDGYQVVLTPHWRPVWIAVAAVFLFQLFKPWLVRAKSAVKLPAAPAIGARSSARSSGCCSRSGSCGRSSARAARWTSRRSR